MEGNTSLVNYMFLFHGKKVARALALTGLVLGAFVFAFLPEVTNAQSFVATAINNILWTFVNVFFGWMVYIGGMVLNFGINEYVIGFAKNYETTGLGFAIDQLWVVVRDIFNLTFIFGLVMIGLKMIFNSDDAGNKRMLVSLIIAALLVNFSLFITKFVIDFSNVAAYQLVSAFPTKAGVADVSGSFLQLMGLTGLFTFSSGVGVSFSETSGYTGLGYIFGTLLLFLVSAFVFLGGGLLLMIRFAVLNIYMVLSPLMFIGMIFPGAASVTHEYWKGFLSRAFFAPAYILMLYLSHKILSSFATTSSGKTLTTMFTPEASSSFASVIPPFILTSIFLIASIVIAQKMGAVGGGAVISAGKAFSGKVKNVALAPARKAARLTSGNLARAGEHYNNKLQTTRGGRAFKMALSAASLGTFTERERLGAIEAGKNAKFGGKYSYKDDQEFDKKTTSRTNQLEAERARSEDLSKAEEIINKTATSSTDLKTSLDNLGKTLRDMSKEEKENLGLDKLTNKNYAVHLSDSDIENLDKSGKFGAQDIKSIKDARSDAFKSIATHGTTHTKKNTLTGNLDYSNVLAGSIVGGVPTSAIGMDQRGDVAKRGAKEVGKMPIEVFKAAAMLGHITPTMMEERVRNGMEIPDRKIIRDNVLRSLGVATGITMKDAIIAGTVPKDNIWAKWFRGNSAFAAEFFS